MIRNYKQTKISLPLSLSLSLSLSSLSYLSIHSPFSLFFLFSLSLSLSLSFFPLSLSLSFLDISAHSFFLPTFKKGTTRLASEEYRGLFIDISCLFCIGKVQKSRVKPPQISKFFSGHSPQTPAIFSVYSFQNSWLEPCTLVQLGTVKLSR